jgi:hypothetical protein
MQALGTQKSDFALSVITQLANVGSKGGKVDEAGMNFILSVSAGIEPRDQLEAMLAAQMAATHMQVGGNGRLGWIRRHKRDRPSRRPHSVPADPTSLI